MIWLCCDVVVGYLKLQLREPGAVLLGAGPALESLTNQFISQCFEFYFYSGGVLCDMHI